MDVEIVQDEDVASAESSGRKLENDELRFWGDLTLALR
jgi:hypothetical protein